jgi:glycosyltransferase involved in cell wall biosynthesis
MAVTPHLTFCIPSYNRVERVEALVRSLLALPDDDIEVVVLDNASTDGTYDILSQIRDPRLKLAANPENRGALYNMVNVFSLATGKYVVYSTDQDKTHIARIAAFKAFLRTHPEVSCGFCNFDVEPGTQHQYHPRGFEAVNAIAYKGRHPTGYFFRNADLRAVRLAERFADFNVVDLFPLEFAFAEVALTGDGAIYNGGLFSPNSSEDVVHHKSSTTNGASRTAFFAPMARLKLALAYTRHVEQLALSRDERTKLVGQIFFGELRAATIGYRNVMSNERLCIHYCMDPRRIGHLELLRIGTSFAWCYLSCRVRHHRASSLRVAAGLLTYMTGKLAQRLARS